MQPDARVDQTVPRYAEPPNLSSDVGGAAFAYRDLGPRDGVPLVLLNHRGAVLDNFDPEIVDGLARTHRVIATDDGGIGGSGGTAPVTIDEMARDARRIPGAKLVIYPDAGHGGIFQFHDEPIPKALAFLASGGRA